MKKYQLTEEDVIHLIEEHENKNEVQKENDLYKLLFFRIWQAKNRIPK